MEKILIGKVTSPVGLKGEVKVYNYSDRTQIYEETEEIIVGDTPRKLQRMRQQKNMLIIKFSGIENRDDAESIRNAQLFVTADDLPELDEGEIYIRDLIGMEVIEEKKDPEHTENIGTVSDVTVGEFQDILKVTTPEGREVMIPAVEPMIIRIDEEEKIIFVDLPEGLLEI